MLSSMCEIGGLKSWFTNMAATKNLWQPNLKSEASHKKQLHLSLYFDVHIYIKKELGLASPYG